MAGSSNVGSVTAPFKRFIKRLAVYTYWPWGASTPQLRNAGRVPKKALLVSFRAAPAKLGRWLFNTRRELRDTAVTLGARPVGTVFTGLIAGRKDMHVPERMRRKAARLARKLA